METNGNNVIQKKHYNNYNSNYYNQNRNNQNHNNNNRWNNNFRLSPNGFPSTQNQSNEIPKATVTASTSTIPTVQTQQPFGNGRHYPQKTQNQQTNAQTNPQTAGNANLQENKSSKQ